MRCLVVPAAHLFYLTCCLISVNIVLVLKMRAKFKRFVERAPRQ